MKYLVDKRRESVRRQLDGLSSGEILHSGETPKFPVRKILGFAIAFVLTMSDAHGVRDAHDAAARKEQCYRHRNRERRSKH